MNTYYLGIDLNLPQNIKIIKLKRKLGFSGFGLYIELQLKLAQSKDYELSTNDYADLAYEFRVQEEYIKELVEGFDLFEFKNDKFFIQDIKTKMELIERKKREASENGKKGNAIRWGKVSGSDSPPISGSDSKPNRNKGNKGNKGKEINKIKENKEIIEEFFENSDFKDLISNKIIAYENQVWFSEQANITIKSIKESMLEYYTENPRGKKQEIKNITTRFYKFLESYKRSDFYKYKEKSSSLGETTTEEQMKDKFANATVWL